MLEERHNRRPPDDGSGERPQPTSALFEPVGPDFEPPPEFRAGYVAICGYPNVGKSTFMNAVLGEKLAIVTPKAQTTRRRTLGILTTPRFQMVFLDTPGILEPRYRLQQSMMKQVAESIADADVLLYIVDVTRPALAEGVVEATREKPVLVVLNKVDLLKQPEETLPIIDEFRKGADFADFFAVSALLATGLVRVIERASELLPVSPPYFPPDALTEHPERFFVAEIIREAVFSLFRQEVPYSTEVEIETFKERPGAKDLIEATIVVESDSQKAILIGKGGRAIKALGQKAREAIEDFLGRPVYLSLRVKVVPGWRKDARFLRRLGYK